MSTSRRYQLRLPASLASELETHARGHGLAISSAIRLLVGRGLLAEGQLSGPPDVPRDSPASLAALVAAEHAVLMVASVLPEGQRRMHELSSGAALAAEERLALFRDRASD